MVCTGPKISSLAMLISSVTPEKTVGWTKKPRSPSQLPPVSRVAPSFLPASMNPRILSLCTTEIWGPCSTPSSQGSPTILALAMVTALLTNSSWMPACTRVRLPAQQFCPWLANSALWAISTCWSGKCLTGSPFWKKTLNVQCLLGCPSKKNWTDFFC